MPSLFGTSEAIVVGQGTVFQPPVVPPVTAFDLFDRTTTSPSIGTSTDGHLWIAQSGGGFSAVGHCDGSKLIVTDNNTQLGSWYVNAPGQWTSAFTMSTRFQYPVTVDFASSNMDFYIMDSIADNADVHFNIRPSTSTPAAFVQVSSWNGTSNQSNTSGALTAVAAGSWYLARFQVSSTVAQGKFWLDGGTEPAYQISIPNPQGWSLLGSTPIFNIILQNNETTSTSTDIWVDYITFTNP